MAKSIDGFLSALNGDGEVGLPDVTTRNDTKREDNVGGLDGGNDVIELLGSTVKINVKASNGELGDEAQVGAKTREVGGKEDFGRNLGQGGVGSDVLRLESLSFVKDEDGLIDLNPLGAGSLQVSEESLVDGDKLGEQADGLEPGLGILAGLSENKERDRSQYDWASRDTGGEGLFVFLNSLVEVQLEISLIRELGDDKVVVRVEPEKSGLV